MTVVFIGLVGVIVGSFINALVWRLRQQLDDAGEVRKLSAKRKKQLSILRGRSMCPKCKHQLAYKDLVPVLSWAVLRGRCRYCKASISPEYPIVELVTGVIFAVTYVAWPLTVQGAEWVIFGGFLVATVCLIALAIYDYHWRILPSRLIYIAGTVYGLSLLVAGIVASDMGRFVQAMSAGVVYLGLFYGIYSISDKLQRSGRTQQAWLGGGDVCLSFVLGLVAGSVVNVFLAMFIASITGLLFAAPGIIRSKGSLYAQIPFGPFLIAGAWVSLLWGAAILEAYTGLLDKLLLAIVL